MYCMSTPIDQETAARTFVAVIQSSASPDRPFHNSGASKSGAQRSWTTQNSPFSWSQGSKIRSGSCGKSPEHTSEKRAIFPLVWNSIFFFLLHLTSLFCASDLSDFSRGWVRVSWASLVDRAVWVSKGKREECWPQTSTSCIIVAMSFIPLPTVLQTWRPTSRYWGGRKTECRLSVDSSFFNNKKVTQPRSQMRRTRIKKKPTEGRIGIWENNLDRRKEKHLGALDNWGLPFVFSRELEYRSKKLCITRASLNKSS